MIVKSKNLDHQRASEVCLKRHQISVYDNTWNLKPVSKEEFQSSAFFGTVVCQKIFTKLFAWTRRRKKKLSDRKFPFQPVISKTASAKFKNDLLLKNHEPKFFKLDSFS